MSKTLHSTAMTRAADYSRTYHHVNLDASIYTLEDVRRPGFWAHHVPRLSVNDIVDVVSTDGSFDVQLRVIGKGIGFVEMRFLRIWVNEEAKQDDPDAVVEALGDIPDNYKVSHTPKTGWRVHTMEPSEEVVRGIKSKNAAINAAIAHDAKANGLAA